MNRRNILMAAVVGTVSAGALGGAYAASSGGKAGGEDAAVIAAVLSAEHSLGDAVRTAETMTKGMAFKAETEDEDGVAVYEISTVAGDAVSEFTIDPATGSVLESGKEGLFSQMLRKDGALEYFAAAKTTLGQAITAAERAAGGKAIEAELDGDAKGPVFAVEVAGADGGLVKVTVDGVSGKVLASGPASDDEKDDGND